MTLSHTRHVWEVRPASALLTVPLSVRVIEFPWPGVDGWPVAEIQHRLGGLHLPSNPEMRTDQKMWFADFHTHQWETSADLKAWLEESTS